MIFKQFTTIAQVNQVPCVLFSLIKDIIRQFTTYLYLGLYIKNYFFSSIR